MELFADMSELIRNGDELASCYFADNDLYVYLFAKALMQNGYRIPEDISIVGFDNMPVSTVIDPALTTVHVPKQYMGEAAARRLISLMKDPGQPPIKIEIDTSLVYRDSVGKDVS